MVSARTCACPPFHSMFHNSLWVESPMEALTIGTPVVAFPQFGDQVTNAKYLVDVFRTGIRLCKGEAKDRIIPK
nr:limonoid UDP-glucosyltransferase-like [Ipomoea trifida]